MIQRDPILTKVRRLFKRKRFGEVIRLLEPEVVRYHDSFKYYYILASSCLRIGDFGGAMTYFKRCRDLKMLDPSTLLGLAALFLRRGDTDRAVDLYLEVQDNHPQNRIARRALKVIRKYGGSETLALWIDSGRLIRVFPPLPSIPCTPGEVILPILGILMLLALSAGGYLIATGRWNPLKSLGTVREGYAETALDRQDRDAPVQIEGSYRYVLTQNEAVAAYEEARRLFTAYRDEAAKVPLNRILESNASDALKNKARLLLSLTDEPGFDTLKDRLSYAEVIREPVLYRDCYVIWRGMASNMASAENSVTFDLLVGYDTRTKLEGVVSVHFNFAVNRVNTLLPLEVLGKIVPVVPASVGDPPIRLQGVAIHQSGLLEPAPDR